jgi:2'-5' RNA ligase
MTAKAPPRDSTLHQKSLRVFFALWPDELARERLAALATSVAREGGGRAIPARNLHVTLAFIGAVSPQRVDALAEAGTLCVREIGAIDMSLARIGGAHNGELVWLAPALLPRELVVLHERLDALLAERGLPVEAREFRPHVTLARRCARRVRPPTIEPIVWRVTRVALMSSTTGADGSEYRELAAFDLA